MSLSEKIKKHSETSIYGIRCKAGQLLAKMPKDDASILINALSDLDTQTTVIVKALNEEGYPIGYDSVARHRRGLCGCSEWH